MSQKDKAIVPLSNVIIVRARGLEVLAGNDKPLSRYSLLGLPIQECKTPIVLTLSLLPDSSNRLRGFTQFWLRYVHGFSPHFHCQKSLLGVNDPRFTKSMLIGRSFELLEPTNYQYIYLCGVTAKKYPGLHLALLPERDATAHATTYNGVEISVTGAKELTIPYLPDGFAEMSRKYTTCRNWQFGVEYYGLENMRRELVRE